MKNNLDSQKIKRGRGRPKNTMSFSEERENCIKKNKRGVPLSFREIAILMSESETNQMTEQEVKKFFFETLDKVKKLLSKNDIDNLQDFI